MPKIKNKNIPEDMTNETLEIEIFNKDDFLKHEITSYATFSVIKSRSSKKLPETPKFKKVLKKCSAQFRNHIINDIVGYDYIGLTI